MQQNKNAAVNKPSLSYRIKKDFVKNRALYLLVLLPIIYYAVFRYGPMYGAIIAFKNFKPNLGILGSKWVGLEHFRTFFSSPSFGALLRNTLKISFSSIVFSFPMPVILALLINELKNEKFAKVSQNFMYMPHFISLVVVCGLVRSFTADNGLIGAFVGRITGQPESLLNKQGWFVPIYIISGIWQEAGWNSIIYVAALAGIDEQLYEAASIDGASRWQKLIHVTLPGIMETIMVLLILKMGNVLNVGFEKIILLYNNATMPVADVISSYVYRKGLVELNWSFSTAVGLFNSVINFLFIIVFNKLSRKMNGYGLW